MKPTIRFRKLFQFFSIAVITLLLVAPLTSLGQRKGPPHHKAKAHHKKKVAESHVAHHHYRHLPRRGAVVTKLPGGLVTISHKGKRLHYHNGVFYMAKGAASFSVVSAPIGLRVKVLPPNHRRIVHGKRHYFYYYGTFYAETSAKEGYEVIEAPVGAEVASIPDGYDMEEIDGVNYYTLEDVKFMAKDKDGETVYEVVK